MIPSCEVEETEACRFQSIKYVWIGQAFKAIRRSFEQASEWSQLCADG